MRAKRTRVERKLFKDAFVVELVGLYKVKFSTSILSTLRSFFQISLVQFTSTQFSIDYFSRVAVSLFQ